MSQHKYIDQNGREWMIGFDNPCGGFYASRWVDDPGDDDPEADVLIGFSIGVDLPTLQTELKKHGVVLNEPLLQLLRDDLVHETRPLTPMQELIRSMVDGARKNQGGIDEQAN